MSGTVLEGTCVSTPEPATPVAVAEVPVTPAVESPIKDAKVVEKRKLPDASEVEARIATLKGICEIKLTQADTCYENAVDSARAAHKACLEAELAAAKNRRAEARKGAKVALAAAVANWEKVLKAIKDGPVSPEVTDDDDRVDFASATASTTVV